MSMQTEEVLPQTKKKDNFLKKLMIKWELDSYFQVILILIVFSLTGSTVVFLRKTFFSWVGFTEATPMWVKTVTYLIVVFPAYQVLLLAYGFLFGQFNFFWNKGKKIVKVLSKPFNRKK